MFRFLASLRSCQESLTPNRTNMIQLCQRDIRWCDVKLGSSTLDIGHFGCTTTSLSMLSDYFGCLVYPDAIAMVKTNYTKAGLILWQNLSFQNFKFDWRDYTRNDAKIQEYLKDPNKAVILNVSDGKHWVAAKRKTLFGNDYVCADPWTGKDCTATKAYGNIVGAAYFSRKK